MISNKIKSQTLLSIKDSGLDPSLFSAENEIFTELKTVIKTLGGHQVRTPKSVEINCFVVRLRNSPLYFAISQPDRFDSFDYQHTMYNPTFSLSEKNWKDVDNLSFVFSNWINTVVKQYLEDSKIPNLWDYLFENSSGTITQFIEAQETELFSEEEKKTINKSIDELRILITSNFELQQKQAQLVNKRLDYLTSAADKHNKFDWKGIAIQTIMSIIVNLSFSPLQGQQLVTLFKHVFSNVHLLQ